MLNKQEDVYLTIAKNIKKYRIMKHLTQKDLANLCGYSYAYIRRIEAPRCTKNFSIQTIYNIAKALNVSFEQLFKE